MLFLSIYASLKLLLWGSVYSLQWEQGMIYMYERKGRIL